MNTLYFEKISSLDRLAEPVTVSIPFAKGKLVDPDCLVIYDSDKALPVQRRVLATWADATPDKPASVKWLLVHIQPDLPGNLDKTLHFDITGSVLEPTSGPEVTVTETERGIRVDTGPLSFSVLNHGFWPICEVVLNGQPLRTTIRPSWTGSNS